MKHLIFVFTIVFLGNNFCYPQIKTNDVPPVKFMVFSDPHYYDVSLGTEGEAFEEYLANDRKLLRESNEIIYEAIKIIKKESPDFVIVPGDLTKDGTMVSHLKFAALIGQIENIDIPVFVIPGNHDVNNGESNSYRGNEKIPVENISPQDFKTIYNKYGYGTAIYSDTNSLSYVTEPAPGLWLLGLDACLYKQNQPGHHPITDGEFSEKTLEWIDSIAFEAKKQGKTLMAFMHHGVLEHYQKQNKFYGEYIVNNYKKVSKRFAELEIKFVFTGHYHAQDIVKKEWNNGKFIFDIETGSLVTYPCPVRKIVLQDNKMHINSLYIESIPTIPDGFVEYSHDYVHAGIAGIAEDVMKSMGLNLEDAQKLSGQIGDAFIAHYRGDEPTINRHLDLTGVGLFGRLLILTKKRLIKELYSDLLPSDNQIIIDLNTGESN